MRKILVFFFVALFALTLSVFSQDAQPNAVTVSDQVSVNGMVIVESVTIDTAGFVAIHADENGMLGHVVGIAPVPAGTSQGVVVLIDGAMATSTLYAELHLDDNTMGVFEYGHVPGADSSVSDPQPFTAAAIVAFDQQLTNDSIVVASAIIPSDGWLVVHADNNGQPGPVLGSSPVGAGTNPAVMVALGSEGITPVIWPMLHVDDGQIGTYEFDGQSGLDSPVIINGVVATKPINLTDAPTLLLADGAPIQSTLVPEITTSAQDLGAGDNNSATLTVDMVTSPAQGFVDVHADMGHPSVSLGHTLVNEGDNPDVLVTLMSPPEGSMLGITPNVWPMLHFDTDQDGEYRYLQIPGVDLPVVYNGSVVTVRTTVAGDMVVTPPMPEMTPEATSEATAAPSTPPAGDMTEEATMEPGEDITPESTMEPMPEPSPEATEAM